MILKDQITDYTAQEFVEFLYEINRAIEDEPDKILTPLIEHFEKITEHPSGRSILQTTREQPRRT